MSREKIDSWEERFEKEWNAFWTQSGNLRISSNKIKAFIRKEISELKAEHKKVECYSCGEPVKYDGDRPECYCNDCLPNDYISKKQIQPIVEVYNYMKEPRGYENYPQTKLEIRMFEAIKQVLGGEG